MEKTWYW